MHLNTNPHAVTHGHHSKRAIPWHLSPEPKANAPLVFVGRICADCLDDKVNDGSSKTWKALHKPDAFGNFGKMCADKPQVDTRRPPAPSRQRLTDRRRRSA